MVVHALGEGLERLDGGRAPTRDGEAVRDDGRDGAGEALRWRVSTRGMVMSFRRALPLMDEERETGDEGVEPGTKGDCVGSQAFSSRWSSPGHVPRLATSLISSMERR